MINMWVHDPQHPMIKKIDISLAQCPHVFEGGRRVDPAPGHDDRFQQSFNTINFIPIKQAAFGSHSGMVQFKR